MKCNYFQNNEENQPGDQPIRVFYSSIINDFNNIKGSLNTLRSDFNFNQVKLHYLTENIKIIGPKTDGRNIMLHDSFLSFLWGYVYSMIVTAPIGGKEVNENENIEARKLRKYAHSLMWGFSNWDKEIMINPELFAKDDNRLIGVSNSIFLLSVRFILFHEFAHIFLGHICDGLVNTILERNKMEFDADKLALEWTIQTLEKDDDFNGKMAIIMAQNALSYSPNEFFETENHPAAEDRIELSLRNMKLNDNDFIWGYATYSIMEWQTNHIFIFSPNYYSGKSYKDLFYEAFFAIKKYKSQ